MRQKPHKFPLPKFFPASSYCGWLCLAWFSYTRTGHSHLSTISWGQTAWLPLTLTCKAHPPTHPPPLDLLRRKGGFLVIDIWLSLVRVAGPQGSSSPFTLSMHHPDLTRPPSPQSFGRKMIQQVGHSISHAQLQLIVLTGSKVFSSFVGNLSPSGIWVCATLGWLHFLSIVALL